jgi:phosphoserine phosphatase
MRYKIVALDFDGVLVKQLSAWWTLHIKFGTYEESRSNLSAYEKGQIGYGEFMKRDISLWGRRSLNEVKDVLLKYDLNPHAKSCIDELKRDGRKVVVVSAGIDLLVGDAAKKLGIEQFLANGLETDPNGYLTGSGIFKVDLKRKDLALKGLIEREGGNLSEVAAVGDSKYDLKFLQAAGLGIGFGDRSKSKELDEVADAWTEKLMEIPKIIKTLEKS